MTSPFSEPFPKTASDLKADESFKQAAAKLKDTITRSSRKHLETLRFPHFQESASLSSEAQALGELLESFNQLRDSRKQDQSLSNRAASIVQRWFRASYPFAKFFLGLAKDASSSVHSHAFVQP
jgi:hypothetical protein